MKILQTIAGFGLHSGGTTSCTYDLLEAINRTSTTADLLTPDIAPGVNDVLAGKGEEWVKAVPFDCKTPYAFSSNFRRYLHKSKYDLYHTNGMWLDANHATCSYARRHQKPYVITPHGMLYPQALAISPTRKKWMRRLLFDRDLSKAACIHATCRQEAEHIRALGIKTPIAVIANPIRIPATLDEAIAASALEREKVSAIGYLGRLHPRKHVDRIIKAFAQSADNEHRLIIMGKGTAEYEQELKDLVKSLHKEGQIIFEGFVSGDEKLRKLASLRALIVASDFENFGMIVGEALLCQTPVICTKTAPWQDLEVYKCGHWVDNDVETLSDHIYNILRLPLSRIETMGRNGRDLIEYDYNPDIIAQRMIRLYHWLLGQGDKPEFVLESI